MVANEQQAESRFAFRSVESNEIVGFCGVTLLDGELDFGYFIRRKYWGQGLAILMCKAAIRKLTQTIDLTEVKVFIASDNVGSQKVAHKLGWQRKCASENEFESGHLYQICT
ncbi:GNAT family N-acetyltransferase [Vibrio lamellibrachiae]|uniref:GNAT family N-acetyltransferase n=1 Tax=Vibrio lamellibrachiae TaxID=2910253 RepID=UPI003D0E5129